MPNMKKYDSLLKNIDLFEKLAIAGSRKDLLKALAQGASFEPEPMTGAIGPIYDPSLESSSPAKSVVPAKHWTPIDSKIQEALNTINVNHQFLPTGAIDTDSKRGPETNAAIAAFKRTFMRNNPSASDAQVIQEIRNQEARVRLHAADSSDKPVDLGPVGQKPLPTGNELHLNPSGPYKPLK
jgi:hypothetical protein